MASRGVRNVPRKIVLRMSHLSEIVFLTALVAASSFSIARARGGKAPPRSRTPARDQPTNVAAAQTPKQLDARSDEAIPLSSDKALAAPWMAPLKRALNHGGTGRKTRDRSEAKRKHVQIATVDPESGKPYVRTVVFRGFLPLKYATRRCATSCFTDCPTSCANPYTSEESCCLCFITDDRSAKFQHLGRGQKHGAPVECCWWLDEAGVQFRIAGRAILATARSEDAMLRAAVQEVWGRLGDSTRRQMYWPHPGAPKGEGAQCTEVVDAEGQISLDESHFVLLIVVPESVDELHLGGSQKRIQYCRAQSEAAAAKERFLAASGTGSDMGSEELLARLRCAMWSEKALNP